ncbi:Ig-like domain-containing domain [Pontibacter liquoris]|uniref:Ig-like domain-containing domain n=1 Tax=Pontibacter liquoris TaxID=2905677 RepID=UPI001FA7B32C|nr:Ig-like domain-containing domain [Pontibacter liquoris]
MKIHAILVAAALITGMSSCASISSPEGGPKDTTPPTLKSSTPKNQQLNVKGKTVSLTFDEEIQAKNLTRELLITPNTNNTYKVKTDKETITLEFEKPLLKNTTYTFNFREGLMDITESNKPLNLKLAFSTGTFIDSSKVAGTVVDLMTQLPEKDAVVALYPANDTLNIREDLPYYQTQTDAAGKYTFENIKEGDYRIYALIDKNKNAIYDNEAEKVAYFSTPIHITSTTAPVLLQTVKIDTKKPILTQRDRYSDRFVGTYNEGILRFSARSQQQPNDTLYFRKGTGGKAFQLFKTPTFNGGKAIFSAVDSSGNIAVDTVQIAFEGKRAQLLKGAQLQVTNNAKPAYRSGQTVTIELETPVKITGNEPVRIMADSVVLQALKYPGQLTLDPSGTELRFQLPALQGRNKQFSLVLDSTAIVPLQGNPLVFPAIPLPIADNNGLGSVKGIIQTKSPSYIIQLLDTKYNPVKEIRNMKTFIFTNLEPGQYYIRVLVDENNNGRWDKPDPKLEKAFEKVYLYPNPIDIRANWELEAIKLEF